MSDVLDTLILAPHVDDEVLGCFSFLGPTAFVHCFGAEDRSYVSRAERLRELEEAAGAAGFRWHVGEHVVNRYDAPSLIAEIEARLAAQRPRWLLVPQPCYNQDHRAVYDAALVAARPHDTNWLVPTVLLYEMPHVVYWPHGDGPLEPNYFRPIDVAAKLALYRRYASQVRGHRSPEQLEALARLRGAAVNVPHAEGFVCRRFLHGVS